MAGPSIVSPRCGLAKLCPNSGGADLARGDDPDLASRYTRRKTMRHWITSFQLLMEAANMRCVVGRCKGSKSVTLGRHAGPVAVALGR
jgi:hypothetical protein